MNKFLLLYNSEKDMMFYQGILPENYQTATIYRNGIKLEKAIQRVWLKYKFPFYKHISLSDWYDEEYDVIMIEILESKRDMIEIIKKRFPAARILLWYWNTVESTNVYPWDTLCENCELWSFDRNDCERYNLKYNTQFYNGNIKLPQAEILYDVFFLGADKGRGRQLEIIKNGLEKAGIRALFYITKNGKTEDMDIPYKKSIGYMEALKYAAGTRAILDVSIRGQQGLTLRTLEALFFSRKLITTNKEIVDYDFYHPSNILILNDNYNEIEDFLNLPYEPVPDAVLNYYEFSNWIQRFTKSNI